MDNKNDYFDEYISIAIVDDLPLRRASIRCLLGDWAREEKIAIKTIEADGPEDLHDLESEPQLVLHNAGAAPAAGSGLREHIDRVRQALPNTPLVIISEGDDAHAVIEALKAGARGFISARTAPSIVFHALRFIMGGGVYFPPSALLQAQVQPPAVDWRRGTGGTGGNAGRERTSASGLTARQAAVWRLLQHGHSNKVIARELSMRESTVKVHMRQIMRKLGATNRTQAALCGLDSLQPPDDHDDSLGGDAARAPARKAQTVRPPAAVPARPTPPVAATPQREAHLPAQAEPPRKETAYASRPARGPTNGRSLANIRGSIML